MNSGFIHCGKILVILLTLMNVNACRFEPQSADANSLAETTSTASTENAKSSHQHHKRVKPGASVSLKDSAPLYALTPGVYEYNLSLISPDHSGKMTVVASVGDGATIISPITHFEFILADNGEYVVPLAINVAHEGRFYIQLHISVMTEGQSTTRVIAVILQVGEPTVKTQKTLNKSSTTSADEVIVLPAQETISPR